MNTELAVPALKQQCLDVFLILLTVVLFKVSFPGGMYPFLAWGVFVPLGIAIHGAQTRYAFVLSSSCAMLGWLSAVWWIVNGVTQIAASNNLVVVPFLLVFCLFYAIPYGVSAALYSRFGWTSSILGACKGAVIWTTISCLVPHILPGNIAHSQYLYPSVIQIVELGGIPILLFAIYLCNFLLVTAFITCRKNVRTSLTALLLALLIPITLVSYGNYRLNYFRSLTDDEKTTQLQVGIVQPNVSIQSRTRENWLPQAGRLSQMTYELLEENPGLDVIVWPEIPPPISYAQYDEDRAMIDEIIESKGIPMIISGLGIQPNTKLFGLGKYYNVSEFVSASKEYSVYRKQKLVPFGEYLPGEQSWPWLRNVFPGIPHYVAGTSSGRFDISDNIRLIPLICYEAVFPKLVRAGVQSGGNVIVNQVDDAWFGRSDGPEIHLALAVFRTVEFRVPLIRASNNGRSILVDYTGETVATSQEVYTEETISGTVNIWGKDTLYSLYGHLILWCFSFLSLLIVFKERKVNVSRL